MVLAVFKKVNRGVPLKDIRYEEFLHKYASREPGLRYDKAALTEFCSARVEALIRLAGNPAAFSKTPVSPVLKQAATALAEMKYVSEHGKSGPAKRPRPRNFK